MERYFSHESNIFLIYLLYLKPIKWIRWDSFTDPSERTWKLPHHQRVFHLMQSIKDGNVLM